MPPIEVFDSYLNTRRRLAGAVGLGLLIAGAAAVVASSPADVTSALRVGEQPAQVEQEIAANGHTSEVKSPPRASWGTSFFGETVANVTITTDLAEWDTLRKVTRNVSEATNAVCKPGGSTIEGFLSSPFEYVSANVTINGETRTNVGLKKKGFLGSGSEQERISMKLKINKYQQNAPIDGINQFVLNSAREGHGEIMVACLVYNIYRGLGLYAPRCGFADVWVNSRHMGVYVNVEDWQNKEWLQSARYGFGTVGKVGNLYGGTMSDFMFEKQHTFAKKTNVKDPSRADLDRAVSALASNNVTAVAEVFDLDSFLTFWALESVLDLMDGYSSEINNFVIYADPSRGGKFVFLTNGPDTGMGNKAMPQYMPPYTAKSEAPASVYANSLLTKELYDDPGWRKKYQHRVRAILHKATGDGVLLQVDRLHGLIRPFLNEDFPVVRTSDPSRTQQGQSSFDQGVAKLKRWIRGRAAVVLADLDTDPQWPWPVSPEGVCNSWGRSYVLANKCNHCILCKPSASGDVEQEQCAPLFAKDACNAKAGCTWHPAPTSGGVSAQEGADANSPDMVCGLNRWFWGAWLYPNKCMAECFGSTAVCESCSMPNVYTATSNVADLADMGVTAVGMPPRGRCSGMAMAKELE